MEAGAVCALRVGGRDIAFAVQHRHRGDWLLSKVMIKIFEINFKGFFPTVNISLKIVDVALEIL